MDPNCASNGSHVILKKSLNPWKSKIRKRRSMFSSQPAPLLDALTGRFSLLVYKYLPCFNIKVQQVTICCPKRLRHCSGAVSYSEIGKPGRYLLLERTFVNSVTLEKQACYTQQGRKGGPLCVPSFQ